ncbi:MAG TPA: hypothetical protein VFS25_05285 [Chitinophaga sp.]|uniref:hypothetical protein n=1 Tax=Chitinophaga sp. TaxID=1869181 RepID=UPI002DB79291|nr:hypothetical protein [Chitinophaga sp.]HEU4552221.1 hypothetical protein [Chitinophaga sp.]
MESLTPEQEIIKEAVLTHILDNLLRQNGFEPVSYRSRQIIRIFRLSPQELCDLREKELIPAVKKNGAWYYNPSHVLEYLMLEIENGIIE